MQFLKIFSIVLTSGIACLLGIMFALTHIPFIDLSTLEHYQPGKPSILLDDEGNEWARFQLDKRQPVPLHHMPKNLINAFIAAEDHDFFSHHGISWRGIIRSVLVNASHQRIVQGASTITQQLIKLLYTDGKRTLARKVKEQLLAIIAEQQFTKEHILEIYLNHVYFGFGIYGVESASQRFWNKPVQDLSLQECATLAAIIRSPALYCPLRKPTNAIKRRNIILSRMVLMKLITDEEYQVARSNSLMMHQDFQSSFAPHFREMLRIHLEEMLGKFTLYTKGLTIQTTLNRKAQESAQIAFIDHITSLRSKLNIPIDGALISLDNSSGGVKALIGGFDFGISQFNRATQAHRQLGSLVKGMIYAAAINNGASFADTEIDEPLIIENEQHGQWQPQNFNKKFQGRMTLAHALSHSNNIISIKTLVKTGFDPIITLLKASGIATVIHPYFSLALGCIDTSLEQAAAMFNIFAHRGVYVKPHTILWIKDEVGNKIWKHAPEKRSILSWKTCSQVARVLELFMERMEKRFPQPWPSEKTIGKTGTTNDARTCWFVGATPHITTAIYIGRDDNQPLGNNVYASHTALPLWLSYHHKISSSKAQFSHDPSLKTITVNEFSGQPSSESSPESVKILVDHP